MSIINNIQKNNKTTNSKFEKRIKELIKINEKNKEDGYLEHCFLSTNIHQEFDEGLYERKKDTEILKARIFIYGITIIRDELELFDPVFTILYKDLIYNENKIIENATFDELVNKLYSERLFADEIKQIRRLINNIIIGSYNKEFVGEKFLIRETKVFKEGFFLKDGKVIENTLITGLKPTKEQIQSSIRLINELLGNRGSAIANDCTVLRFMLCAPFGWCMKEIGKAKGLYGLILAGTPQTNKTGSCLNFSWIYSTPQDMEKAVNTTSVFGSRLEEGTLPAIIDEAYKLISQEDMQDPMKRCIYNKDSRSTKDKSNPQITINYLALGLPIFTMNEYKELKNFTTRRYHINYYSPSMVVSDKDAEEFENKYAPEYEDSPLKELRYLGRAFADKFIPYIESQSEELFDLEALTIKILKEIAEEVGEEFNPSVYEIQESADNFDEDKCIAIRSGLNKLFRKNHYKAPGLNYTLMDFIDCANTGEINWLYYKNAPKDRSKDEKDNPATFVINKKGFEKEVSHIVDEHMDYNSILEELDISTENITSDQIHTNRGNTRGFKISSQDLIQNVFDMYINTIPNSEDEKKGEN